MSLWLQRSNLIRYSRGLLRQKTPPKDSPSPCRAGSIFFALHRGSATKIPPEWLWSQFGILTERM